MPSCAPVCAEITWHQGTGLKHLRPVGHSLLFWWPLKRLQAIRHRLGCKVLLRLGLSLISGPSRGAKIAGPILATL